MTEPVGATRTDLTVLVARSPAGIAVFLAAGAIASGLGVLLAYAGTARVGASVGTAVVNSRPLFVALLGFVLLGESLSPVTIAGIAVLVGGLVFIALSRGGDLRGWRPIELAFPVAAAGAFALGNVARRYGLTRTDVPLFEGIAINALGGLLVLLAYVAATRGRAVLRAPRVAYGWFVVMGSTVPDTDLEPIALL